MSFSGGGQFGLQAADTTNGNTIQFINPGGGFGFGTEWHRGRLFAQLSRILLSVLKAWKSPTFKSNLMPLSMRL
jgi:hypothetical protein